MSASLKRFYPSLDEVVSLDGLPDELNFVKDKIENLLDQIFYKDLIGPKVQTYPLRITRLGSLTIRDLSF